jgi:hypothetical protein
MPAAYVEIIKYALGDQVGAVTTLRGLLYTTEEGAEKTALLPSGRRARNVCWPPQSVGEV